MRALLLLTFLLTCSPGRPRVVRAAEVGAFWKTRER